MYAKDGKSLLFTAAEKGHIKMAKELIAAGLDINHKSKVSMHDIFAHLLAVCFAYQLQ